MTDLSGDASRVEFDRLDDGLPVNFGIFGALQFRYVPIPDELARYLLTVRGLPPGRYEILAIETRHLGQDETTEILWSRQDPPNAIREDELPY